MTGIIFGLFASVGFLLIARWRNKDSQTEIAMLSDLGVGGSFGATVRALLRLEPHFYVFASGMVAGITILRASAGMGE